MTKIKIVGNVNSKTGKITFYDKSFIEDKIKEAKSRIDNLYRTQGYEGNIMEAESELKFWENSLQKLKPLKLV